jgi:hypothetical protein
MQPRQTVGYIMVAMLHLDQKIEEARLQEVE